MAFWLFIMAGPVPSSISLLVEVMSGAWQPSCDHEASNLEKETCQHPQCGGAESARTSSLPSPEF